MKTEQISNLKAFLEKQPLYNEFRLNNSHSLAVNPHSFEQDLIDQFNNTFHNYFNRELVPIVDLGYSDKVLFVWNEKYVVLNTWRLPPDVSYQIYDTAEEVWDNVIKKLIHE